MDKSITFILSDIQKKVEKLNLKEAKKNQYLSQIKDLIENYRNLSISDNHKEVYDSLIKKGKELAKEIKVSDAKKLETYLRYCNAALYDLKGELKPLARLVRFYIMTCILFLALSPQYFSFILPLLFVVPIYLGLKGMKTRSLSGFMMGMSVMPMALLTSVVWLRSGYLASKDFDAYVASIAQQINRPESFARNITIIFTVLSVVLLISSVYTIVAGIKYRKMFV
jgi:hypothetical protein